MMKIIFKSILLSLLRIVTLGKGINKRIGNITKFYKFDVNFIKADFSGWGNDHNSGFMRIMEYAKDKKIVFDVGAHIGLYTLPLSDVIDKTGHVYAFEPSNINRMYLKNNIRLNKIENVIVLEDVIGEANKSDVCFYEATTVSGMNSVINYKKSLNMIKLTKKQISLDSFCAKHTIAPEIIKIDVEGAEIFVLKGGEFTIKKYKPILFLSVHPKHLDMLGFTTELLYDYIIELGYSVFTTDEKPVYTLHFAEYILKPSL